MKNYKILMIALIALAVFIPVFASANTWMNDQYYTNDSYSVATNGDTVVHTSDGVDSKYNPNVGSKYDLSVNPNTYSGRAEVRIRSGSNLMNPTMELINWALPNDTPEIIPVEASGVTGISNLPEGKFQVTLHTFDLGNQVQNFTIKAGQQEPTYVVFMGQAFSQSSTPHVPVINILRASYGAPFSFYVTKATYGFGDKVVDVTGKVNNMICGNTLYIKSDYSNQHYNALFGDPDYGVVKNLIVTYVANGVSNTVTVNEKTDMNIVVTSTGSEDVSAYFQNNLVGNKVTTTTTGSSNDWSWLLSFQSFYGNSFYDPAPGIVKGITVTYDIDGGNVKTIFVPNVNAVSTTITFN